MSVALRPHLAPEPPGYPTPEACRMRRTAMGLTPARLATLAGLTERTVLRFEARLVNPRPGTVIALRRGLRAAALATREPLEAS